MFRGNALPPSSGLKQEEKLFILYRQPVSRAHREEKRECPIVGNMSSLNRQCDRTDHICHPYYNIFYYYTRVGTLIVATIYLQLIQNRYMFRSFTVLQCSHQHCVQPRCQRCGSRRIPLAAPVVLIVRMERSTA